MKRILTAAAALLFSVAMSAQSNDAPPPSQGGPQGGQMRQGRPPMSPEQRAKRETEQMNSLVPLGAAYQKVLDANTQYNSKRESIVNGARRNEWTDDQKSQLKALAESHKKDIEAAMGPDLYQKYKAAEKAKREEMRNSHQAGDGQGPPPGN
jgi:Spy/CpxP family protein refolding chaperone